MLKLIKSYLRLRKINKIRNQKIDLRIADSIRRYREQTGKDAHDTIRGALPWLTNTRLSRDFFEWHKKT